MWTRGRDRKIEAVVRKIAVRVWQWAWTDYLLFIIHLMKVFFYIFGVHTTIERDIFMALQSAPQSCPLFSLFDAFFSFVI